MGISAICASTRVPDLDLSALGSSSIVSFGDNIRGSNRHHRLRRPTHGAHGHIHLIIEPAAKNGMIAS